MQISIRQASGINPKIDGKIARREGTQNRPTFREVSVPGAVHTTVTVLIEDDELFSIEDQIRKHREKRALGKEIA